jgi:hypothetical protein
VCYLVVTDFAKSILPQRRSDVLCCSPAGECKGHYLSNEKHQNEDKSTPAETSRDGGGS